MSFWGRKGLSTVRPNAPKIRIEKVAATPSQGSLKTTSPCPETKQKLVSESGIQSRSLSLSKSRVGPKNCKGANALETVKTRKRSPVEQRIESDSDDDGSVLSYDTAPRKKAKVIANITANPERCFSSLQAFSEEDERILIHAADIACTKLNFPPAFRDASTDDVCILLHYPGSSIPERYVRNSLFFSKY
jgi:hypothetical protein